MKKLKQTLVAGALLAMPVIASTTAGAASTCQIGYTGPNSNNLCTSTTTYQCEVVNDTTVKVTNDNTQISVSGSATNGGNTNGGNAQTGSATNSNGTTFTATVVNNECSVVATVPATTTPPAKDTVKKQAVSAPVKKSAPMLANTAGDNTAGIVAGLLAATAGSLTILKLATIAYARRHQ
jgi:membrane-bound inhibitor of C-type lysozyme